jgi:hypothetical protein
MVSWLHCFWACDEAENQGKEHMVRQSGSSHKDQEAEGQRKGLGTKCALQGHDPSDLLPLTRSWLPKFPSSSNNPLSYDFSSTREAEAGESWVQGQTGL